jgi:hypothetical protein
MSDVEEDGCNFFDHEDYLRILSSHEFWRGNCLPLSRTREKLFALISAFPFVVTACLGTAPRVQEN